MADVTEKHFIKITNALKFDLQNHLIEGELSENQEKYATWAIDMVKKNIPAEESPKKWGGKVNEDALAEIEEQIQKFLENPVFKEFKDNLEKPLAKYVEKLKEVIEETVMVTIPLQDMPFPEVTFRVIPYVTWKDDKISKLKVETGRIVFTADIAGIISRTILFGKMKDADPLFAPLIGELDMADYKPDADAKGPLSKNVEFVDQVITALDRPSTRNHVVRYHREYERIGQPICDFLMRDEQLLEILSGLDSALDTKRQTSNAAIIVFAYKQDNSTFILVQNEGGRSATNMEDTFHAILNFSSALFEVPSTKKAVNVSGVQTEGSSEEAAATSEGGGAASSPSGGGSAPAAPKLAMWTEEELAEESKTRGLPSQDLAVWTEDELEAQAEERGVDLNLPVWTEEDLQQESKRRMGEIDIPEWTAEDGLPECVECGYTLQPGWSTCPVCGGASSRGAAEDLDGEEEEEYEYEEVEVEVEVEVPVDENGKIIEEEGEKIVESTEQESEEDQEKDEEEVWVPEKEN